MSLGSEELAGTERLRRGAVLPRDTYAIRIIRSDGRLDWSCRLWQLAAWTLKSGSMMRQEAGRYRVPAQRRPGAVLAIRTVASAESDRHDVCPVQLSSHQAHSSAPLYLYCMSVMQFSLSFFITSRMYVSTVKM